MKKLGKLLKELSQGNINYLLVAGMTIELYLLLSTESYLVALIFSTILLFSIKDSKFYSLYLTNSAKRQLTQNKEASSEKSKIPELSLFFAILLQKPEDRQFARRCILERFEKECEQYGSVKARLLMWRDTFVNVYPAISRKIAQLSKMAIWGYIFEKFTK